MDKKPLQMSDDSYITIPIRNLIGMIVVTAICVMGYFELTERITLLERDAMLRDSEMDLNTEFRIKWPRGEMGSLPDDAEQNIRLNYVEKKLENLENKVEIIEEYTPKS